MSDITVFGHHIGEVIEEVSKQLEEKAQRNRMCMFPIKDVETFDSYEKQVQVFWTYKNYNYNNDKPDYLSLPKAIKNIIIYPNAMFANGDGIIINNIVYRLLLTSVDPEETAWYGIQIGIETIHAVAYNHIITAIIPTKEQQLELFNAVSTLPSVAKISQWMKDMTCAPISRAEVLVAFACGEGLLFPTSFVPIFYMRIKNKMQVMVDVNKEISRDESLHLQQGIILIRRTDISKQRITEIIKEFIVLIEQYIEDMTLELEKATREELMGSDGTDYSDFRRSELMAFAHYNADMLLKQLGCEPLYNTDISHLPDWLLSLSCSHKNNFHERPSVNYTQGSDVFIDEDTIDLDV
jgi:ribonucleoside-diphosphate reductase subunit M2